ncbi:MAG: methyltransferase domain-containing protein [bacterium]
MSASSGASSSLLGENVRRLLRQVLGHEDIPASSSASSAAPLQRRSNGLREFWGGIEPIPRGGILDLGSASQSNLSFITSRGYKLYAEDLVRVALRASAPPNGKQPVSEEERFFRENLSYSEGQFTGILCWDLLDFLPEPLVQPFVKSLHYFLKPGGNLLAFFHTGAPGQEVPLCQYRIRAEDALEVTGRTSGKLRRHFNNRAIENLFRQFSSLKFYLSRDSLREVIIVR